MRTPTLWILWASLTAGGAAALGTTVWIGGDRTALLPGETAGVHHQFEASCDSCHGADPFSSPKQVAKKMNAACRDCHDDELKASDDSHPRKKFRDPRMADYWSKLDVRDCTTCHVEHAPEITRPGAVTLAMDYCVACHSEGKQDVRKNRASHAGLAFTTCASSGCHNFHDNRALYEDFLVRHADAPWLSAEPVLAHAAALRTGTLAHAKPRGEAVGPEAADAPADALARFDGAEMAEWAASAHAGSGVTCAYCHAPKGARKADAERIAADWTDDPGYEGCKSCHRGEVATWRAGRHGMRFHPGLAKARRPEKRLEAVGLGGLGEALPETILAYLADREVSVPMSVAEARIPMKPDAAHRDLSCSSCHDPHSADLAPARVDACLGCHDDRHSRSYEGTPHHETYLAEIRGEAAPGTGVGCADCHMPKIEDPDTGRVFTTHNQNEFLRPNEKMIRPVCLSCHGLGFAIDALADPDLVGGNFEGRPARHVESIDWAVRRVTTEEPRQ